MRSVLVTILAFYYRIFYTSASTLHTPATWCLLRVHDYTCLVFFSGALLLLLLFTTTLAVFLADCACDSEHDLT